MGLHRKEQINWRKHRISFDQAASVFDDPHRLTEPDDYKGEDRLRTIGMVKGEVLLFVVYTIRGNGAIIRIINARHAEPCERRRYGNRKI